jgi:hypothetical protein
MPGAEGLGTAAPVQVRLIFPPILCGGDDRLYHTRLQLHGGKEGT